MTGVQNVNATCPSGKRVLGMGARVLGGGPGRVVLHTARVSDTGTVARVRAREATGGFSDTWAVESTAICAITPKGYATQGFESPCASESETL